MTHTKGPWEVRDGRNRALVDDRYTVERITEGLRSIIAEVNDAWVCAEHGGTGAQANAHLIAAAPALYEALKALHPFVNQFHCGACKALALVDQFVEKPKSQV